MLLEYRGNEYFMVRACAGSTQLLYLDPLKVGLEQLNSTECAAKYAISNLRKEVINSWQSFKIAF
jgi:hypothetical protein